MHTGPSFRSCLSGLAAIPMLVVLVLCFACLPMGGCEVNPFGPTQAEKAQAENERRIAELEAAKLSADAEREKVAAQRDAASSEAAEKAAAIAAVDADLAIQYRAKADAALAKLNEQVKGWEDLAQASADQLAARYKDRSVIAETIADESERREAGLDIADGLIGAGSVFLPGLAALRVFTGLARRRGKTEGAGTVADHIDQLRALSPELDEAFSKLSGAQKSAAQQVLATIPKWKTALGVK